MKNPRFEDDALAPLLFPDADKIPCKNCTLREKDHVLSKGTVLKGATYSMCEAFDDKPDFILFDGEDCPYHIPED